MPLPRPALPLSPSLSFFFVTLTFACFVTHPLTTALTSHILCQDANNKAHFYYFLLALEQLTGGDVDVAVGASVDVSPDATSLRTLRGKAR